MRYHSGRDSQTDEPEKTKAIQEGGETGADEEGDIISERERVGTQSGRQAKMQAGIHTGIQDGEPHRQAHCDTSTQIKGRHRQQVSRSISQCNL
jgi:hypothetical protein